MMQLALFAVAVEPCGDWVAGFHECISEGISNADLIPYTLGACPIAAIAHIRMALEVEGWVWNQRSKQLERGGWSVWFRSQGRTASPIAQWDRVAA